MKKESRKFLIFSLLMLFAMIFTWNSCTKQDEVTNSTNEIEKYVQKDGSKILNEQVIVDLLNKSEFSIAKDNNTELENRNVNCEPTGASNVYCTSYHVNGFINVPPNGNTPGCDNVPVNFFIYVLM